MVSWRGTVVPLTQARFPCAAKKSHTRTVVTRANAKGAPQDGEVGGVFDAPQAKAPPVNVMRTVTIQFEDESGMFRQKTFNFKHQAAFEGFLSRACVTGVCRVYGDEVSDKVVLDVEDLEDGGVYTLYGVLGLGGQVKELQGANRNASYALEQKAGALLYTHLSTQKAYHNVRRLPQKTFKGATLVVQLDATVISDEIVVIAECKKTLDTGAVRDAVDKRWSIERMIESGDACVEGWGKKKRIYVVVGEHVHNPSKIEALAKEEHLAIIVPNGEELAFGNDMITSPVNF